MTEITHKLGIDGKAYDAPGTKRAYTYTAQPDNSGAWNLGLALQRILNDTAADGDLIDSGLRLLKHLEAAGFGVFELEEGQHRIEGEGE